MNDASKISADPEFGGQYWPVNAEVQIEHEEKRILLYNRLLIDHSHPECGRNVRCYDRDGKLVWKIQDHGVSMEFPDGGVAPIGYISIWMEDASMRAYDPSGYEYDIDISSGKIKFVTFVR